MSFDWTPSGTSSSAEAPQVDRVLFEYEGPRMVLAHDARERQLLGVAVDEHGQGLVRWLFAPVSPTQLIAVLERRADLRSCFTGTGLEVVDLDAGWRARSCWTVDSDELPEALLPARAAEIPGLSEAGRTELLERQRHLLTAEHRSARSAP